MINLKYIKLRNLILFTLLLLFQYSCQNGKENDKLKNKISIISENYVDSTISNFLDTIQDESLNIFLDSLVLNSDTSLIDIDLKKRKRSFSVLEYSDLRDSDGHETGFTTPVSHFYRDILPFSNNEKLYFDLLASLTREALYLSNRNNFIYPEIDIQNPSQTGLGYSWGSKDFDKRQNPTGEGDSCTYKIYGLDCSGFIYQLFKRSGITFPKGRAADQCKTATLTKALLPYFGNLKNFNVNDLGQINISRMETGDIIYFKNRNGEITHIGICLKNIDSKLYFYESSGGPNKCAENISAKKGIRGIVIDKRLGQSGRNYSIVRISIPSEV